MVNPIPLLLKTVAVTLLIEGVTLLFRFGFGLRSSEATQFLKTVTLNVRVHHGYVGLVLFPATFFGFPALPLFGWICATWLAFVISDLIHHFLILWPLTGSPEFDLFYPDET